MYFLSSFYDHLRYFRAAARGRGADGEFQLNSMNARVRIGGKEVEFRAQFLVRQADGTVTYSMNFDDSAIGFVGWMPYFNKRWPEATDKLAFKQRCAQAGLPTPLWSTGTVSPELGDFLIKRTRGSLGHGIRGPFPGAAAAQISVGLDEFAERYFLGPIGKAWYWNDRVVALELRDPPAVVGDGVSTVGELVRRGSRRARVDEDSDFLRYRNLSWKHVPAAGARTIVDFKYGSLCYPFEFNSLNRFEELKDGPIVEKLNGWGPRFWSFIPQEIRPDTLYSVDFVIARDGGMRLLEMNCNPAVPPEVYEVIFAAVFEGAPDTAAVRVADASGEVPSTAPPMPPPAPPPSVPTPSHVDAVVGVGTPVHGRNDQVR